MSGVVAHTNSLAVGYGSRIVLANIELTIGTGSFTVLIGANGSGKSTLLRTLSGSQKPLSGHVFIGGKDISTLSHREIAQNVSLVLTDRNGGGGLTVEETVAIGRYPYTGITGRMSDNDKEIVDRAISLIGIGHMQNRLVGTLSDGERQKTMIARALAQDTPLLIMDEPTAFLDVAGRIEIIGLLKSLALSGKSIILSTHDIDTVLKVADNVWIVDKENSTVISSARDTAIENGSFDLAFPSLIFDKTTSTYNYRE